MDVWSHVAAGVLAVIQGPAMFHVGAIPVSVTIVMILAGFLAGIAVGATPGLAGPMAMAVSLPILISVFGYEQASLLPVLGFLIGVMKGATVGGAVPAILFNTPGTPDALLTTYDGYPMTRNGQSGKALRIAHFSSVSGDTLSDILLFLCAPFLAVLVESFLDLPEKTALILLSMAFIAAVVGKSVMKGLLAAGFGMLVAFVGTGEEFYPRLSAGLPELAQGIPVVSAILGMLILGEVIKGLEDLMRERSATGRISQVAETGDNRLALREKLRLLPFIGNSAAIGAIVGILPGVGSTLAATLGYASGRRKQARRGGAEFGTGAPEGVASTEAANSAVSGANLIPVLSLGIPGNTAAVFLILAMETIGGFNPGPSVFRIPSEGMNEEMVIAFGIFTAMVIANLLNWTIGGAFMRWMGIMIRIPKQILLPSVLLVTMVAIYAQETSFSALVFALGFGVLGYFFRKLHISVLPFVIAFILAGTLERTARQAFSATGGDPFFLFSSPLAAILMIVAVALVILFGRRRMESQH
ncbi:MAG: tripartite tricarboxylate transporter permease [Albidovulum sp.]|nr:tripartite tricarboxylate transporter permease [Albidovulum sp.]MDE0530026.1 tripartite tricarboxylate transporter permease [Albidovulum sp.]